MPKNTCNGMLAQFCEMSQNVPLNLRRCNMKIWLIEVELPWCKFWKADIWSISKLSKSFMVAIRSPDILARLVQTACLGCLTSYFNSASLTNFILKLLLIEVSLVRMPPKTTMESSFMAS